MKSYLLYPAKDYIKKEGKNNYSDLWYDTIVNHLCVYDKYVKDIYLDAENLMTTDPSVIKFRQEILKDCLRNKDVITNFYGFICELLTKCYNNRFEIDSKKVTESYLATLRVLPDIMMALENINRYFEKFKDNFKSDGLKSYIERYLSVFTLDYIKSLNEVRDLTRFQKGYFASASLDEKLDVGNIHIYDAVSSKKEIKKELFATGIQLRGKVSILPEYEVEITEDKEWKRAIVIENPKALAASEEDFMNFTDEALLSVAPKIINIVYDIHAYFSKTREEMAFYIGAMNLYDKLMAIGAPICTPVAHEKTERVFKCDGTYDVALVLQSSKLAVGNTLDSQNKSIFFITGANQGGKTTFLRSYGQAIIMMQLGLFVSGRSFESNTFENVFTHFNKEEDKTMESGKLDEELGRLNMIVNDIKPNSLMLFNESFQSTSELEGSTIALDVIKAFDEKRISVVAVSHMYHLYTLLEKEFGENIYYLRASRGDDGARSFKLVEDKPLRTSFALDLYKEIF